MQIFPVFLIICTLDQPNPQCMHLQASSSSPLLLFTQAPVRLHYHSWSAREYVDRVELEDSFDCRRASTRSHMSTPCHSSIAPSKALCVYGRWRRSAPLTRRGVRWGDFHVGCVSLPWQPKSPYRALSLLIGALAFEMRTMIRPRAWRLSPLLIAACGDFQPRYKRHTCTQFWHIVVELPK